MTSEHYFSEVPGSDFKARELRVTLADTPVTVVTSGGIFSPDRIDPGTSVLLEHLAEAPPSGDLLDVGCGWGPIALSLAMKSPLATVWAIDVNERSLNLTRQNADRLGLKNVRACRPEEIPEDLQFQGIWSNPPIRVGKGELHSILQRWLPRLAPDGESFLVVQKNLGADSLHRWLEAEFPKLSTIRFDTARQYRVLRVKRKS